MRVKPSVHELHVCQRSVSCLASSGGHGKAGGKGKEAIKENGSPLKTVKCQQLCQLTGKKTAPCLLMLTIFQVQACGMGGMGCKIWPANTIVPYACTGADALQLGFEINVYFFDVNVLPADS